MVDALHDIRRTLSRDGTLIDLRPVSAAFAIELLARDGSEEIGQVDGFGMAADDAAADRAIEEAVSQGWFARRHSERFDFAFWWDTVPEMMAALGGSRRARAITPSLEELEAIRDRASAATLEPIRLRCRRPTMLSSYTSQ